MEDASSTCVSIVRRFRISLLEETRFSESLIKRGKLMDDMRKLTSWLSGAVGIISAIFSIVFLFQKDFSIAIIFAIGFLIILLLAFLYIAFAKTPPLVAGGKGVYRFAPYGHLSLIGIGLIVGLVVAVLVFEPSRSFIALSLTGKATPSPTPTVTVTVTPTLASTSTSDVSMVLDELDNLRNEIAVLQQRINVLEQSLPVTATNTRQAQVLEDINSLNTRLEVIELAVLDSPAKVLELTLLAKDMENLQQNYQDELESTREEIDRVYDQNKWFLGLMFTMAIGLIGLAVSNFLTKPKGESEKNNSKKH